MQKISSRIPVFHEIGQREAMRLQPGPKLIWPIADRFRRKNNLNNIDYSEIEKFDRISDRWWDLDGEMKSLHDINPLRIGYIRRRSRLRNANVLDVGCGGGILSEALALEGAVVTGIDMANSPLMAARAHLKLSGLKIDYHRSTVEKWSGANPGEYDVVTCMELLEHVPDPGSVVRSCARLARPGGDVFFATLNRTPKSFLYAIVGAEYVLRILPRNTHQYRKFVRPSEMKRHAEQSGLLISDFTGMHYNLIENKYWLGGDLLVNYLMHFKKPYWGLHNR